MFGLLKFLFYSCVAVVVGVVIGTVPIQGRTVAERIAGLYQSTPLIPSTNAKKAPPPKALARTSPRGKVAGGSAAPIPAPSPAMTASIVAAAGAPGPVSAGAANSPERHTEQDKAALDQLLAAKAKKAK